MLIIEHTIETTLPLDKIWAVLVDFESWKKWDQELEDCDLYGIFQAGTIGYIKLKDGPRLKTLLTYVEPYRYFVQEAYLLLAKAIMTNSVIHNFGKTSLRFKTEICGPFAILYYFLIGKSIKNKVQMEMVEMLKLVESNQAK